MLTRFPLEILVEVLSSLEHEDLQAVRLVNRALSSHVVPVLFRTVYISCLTLDRLQNITRHPTLCQAVEELQYQEINFDLIIDDRRSRNNEDPTFWRVRRTEYLTETIAEFIESSNPTLESLVGEPGGSDPEQDDTTMVDSVQGPNEGEIPAMIHAIRELYVEKVALQNPQHLYEIFREAFPRLRNLRRVICVEAGAGCIALDSPRLERLGAFQRLREVFPMPDYAIRLCLQPDTRDWPSHGFMGIWRALSDQDSNSDIRHLEIRRDCDLFLKRGIYLRSLGSQDNALVNGFRNLTVLSLCLEVNMQTPSDAIPQATILAEALSKASKLKRLEICLTSGGVRIPPAHNAVARFRHFGIPFGAPDVPRENILPFVSFPELHTVVFEEVDFTIEQICSWLFMQPKLRHLTLRRPYLRGRWQDLIQKWSEHPDFLLDSLEINSPWDFDNRDLEEDVTRPDRAQVPSRVRGDAILDFIKNGGMNPFEVRSWKPCNVPKERGNGPEDDNLSDYSDLSEWLPEDHPTPVEDPDGPEFDEDYDFDAEEHSDFEMEEAGPS